MSFKSVIPFLLMGTTLTPAGTSNTTQPESKTDKSTKIYHQPDLNTLNALFVLGDTTTIHNDVADGYLDNKAKNLRDIYVRNMLAAQAKLNPLLGKRGYSAAVRQELPGAPVGMHCVWGQHTQLARALAETGDTMTIIPDGARTACVQFKSEMRKKYKPCEYTDCISEGVLYESQSDFLDAQKRFLVQNKVWANAPDSVKQKTEQKFQQKNFCADDLNPGTILIVPRYRGSKNQFHAIMYLGRGYVQDGKFVADANGRHIYTGHNRENIGDLFKAYDTSNVFAADIKNIAKAEYTKELERIKAMSDDELRRYLGEPVIYSLYPRKTLLNLAIAKYFNKDPDNYLYWWDAPLMAHAPQKQR